LSAIGLESLQSILTELLLILFVPVALSILLWSLYNLSIFTVGIRFRKKDEMKTRTGTPFITLIVPAKGEENVIPRLMDSLLGVDYPKDRMEVLVVEDGSTDRTGEICIRYASQWPSLINYLHKPTSSGKPSALNFALQHTRGDIVGVLDADSVPSIDLLERVADRFADPKVTAVQGITNTINAQTNMLTKIVSLEESAWFKAVLKGKDRLSLFVPLTGSCQFIRAATLKKFRGWQEDSLTEDVELAARLLEAGHRVKFCEEAISSQEAPSRLSNLFRQRSRWYRGYIETAIKYGKLLRRPDRSRLDAEISLAGPLLLSVSFANYLLSSFVFTFSTTLLARVFAYLMVGLSTILLLALGFALVYTAKPRRLSNLLWVPFIYGYWFLQTVIAAHALLSIVFRRPRTWTKTQKTGLRA
jgi:cellulose synthase/poly-beta-1,6-N-acetylglucosamine synthase-like glycosyltransferase